MAGRGKGDRGRFDTEAVTIRKGPWIALTIVFLLILAGLMVQVNLSHDDGGRDVGDDDYGGSGNGKSSEEANTTDGVENGTGEVVLTLSADNITMDLTMSDIFELDNISGPGGYVTTGGAAVGPFTYAGAGVLEIMDLVGGIGVAQSLLVKSTGGGENIYTHTQVEGNVATYDENGLPDGYGGVTMLLAYSEAGEQQMDGGPLRVVYVEPGPSDGEYTSEMLWTSEVTAMEIL